MTSPPNVLWIMADQLRYDYLSCYGHSNLHTPNIDALASRGVQFSNAYVQSPVCGHPECQHTPVDMSEVMVLLGMECRLGLVSALLAII